jgi:alkanesulfonate monooxygenase SsuD/methylene tetrahydromethanopterin reductase-like flavin-dependent oxidoreductase (luciferase family)
MNYAVMLPYMVGGDRGSLIGWARAAEDIGFRTVMIGERMSYPNLDQTVALSAAAAVTNRVRVLANACIVPTHPAGVLAKQFASLDVLSQGRFVAAAGVGVREQDYRAADVAMERRWPRAEENIRTMRRIWAGEPLAPGDDPIGPRPYTPGGPELWIGSRGPRALERAVRWGATGFSATTRLGGRQELANMAKSVIDTWAAAGTDRPYLLVSCYFALGDDAEHRLRSVVSAYYSGWASRELHDMVISEMTITSESRVQEFLDNAEAAGFDEAGFLPMTDDLAELERLEAIVSAR